jgi:proteic killer suppression protein
MEIEFRNEDLDRLETELKYTAAFAPGVVKAYRKRIQAIRAAKDERDLHATKGNHFEKLKGDRAHQHSLRLNDKMRLIVEIERGEPKNTILIIGIEDYH